MPMLPRRRHEIGEPIEDRRACRLRQRRPEDAALEIAAEFLLDVAQHGPLGGIPPASATG